MRRRPTPLDTAWWLLEWLLIYTCVIVFVVVCVAAGAFVVYAVNKIGRWW